MSERVKPDGYNTPVPAKILTADRVETRIGTLEFADGFPTEATAELLYDHLDFMRGVEAFLSGVPAASLEAMRVGMEEVGVTACHQIGIVDRLLDSAPLFLTGNTDTVYASGILDLERDGPTVVEIPPGCGPTTVNDAWFRFITDMGRPGPDRGQGGRYLIVPAGYDGPIPDGYFVSESPSRINWLIARGLLVDGKPEAPTKNFHEGLRVYPLSQVDAPPATEFISLSGKEFNTIHANDVSFFDELDAVIQREPLGVIDPEIRGLLASIGITKGTPFAPDERMRGLLTEAAAVAERHRSGDRVQDPRPRGVPLRRPPVEDGVHRRRLPLAARGRRRRAQSRRPHAVLLHRDGEHAGHGTAHSRRGLPVRVHRARQPGRVPRRRRELPDDPPARRPGQGLLVDRRLRPPDAVRAPDRPAVPQPNNTRDPLATNADGSITLTFGPSAPNGSAGNWIQTVPGKKWFAILRLYGPLEPWFDKSWIPGDVEPLEAV